MHLQVKKNLFFFLCARAPTTTPLRCQRDGNGLPRHPRVKEAILFKSDRGGVVGLMLIVASSLRPTREPAIAPEF